MALDKYVWVIGGGQMQLPLIEDAKGYGYQVLVTDQNPKAVGAKSADQFVKISTYDVAGHRQLARELKIKPSAVLADAIDVGPTAAAVADDLGLPSVGYGVAERARNKATLRNTLAQGSAGSWPVYATYGADKYSAEMWVNWQKRCRAAEIMPLPCVIKSVDNCASRGVSKVADLEDWNDAVVCARNYNKNSQEILIEQLLDGPEFSSDWFVFSPDDVLYVNGAVRLFDDTHFGMERAYTNPWLPPTEVQAQAERAVKLLGMTSGPLKLDFINDKEHGWLIVEAATRWSGGFDHTHAQVLSCGRRLTEQLLRWGLGYPVTRTSLRLPEKHRYAAGLAPYYKPGAINGWTVGPEARIQLANGFLFPRTQKFIENPDDCGTRPLFIIAADETPELALGRVQTVASLVQPNYVAD
jgi:biotin carboxylase